MSNQQQYVKNTNKPDADSYLWTLGNNWRISGGSGDIYCPLKFDKEKEISNLQLFTSMMEVLDKPIAELDYASIKGFFFLPVKTQDGDALLWVYTDEEKVKKKKANTIKYSGQQTQQATTTNTVPKPTTSPVAGTLSTPEPTRKTITVNPANVESMEKVREKVLLEQDHIITYTDPNWVEGGSDIARELESKGYSYIPRSLATTTGRIETVYDKDEETGNTVEVGQRSLYLMGRIINVKIADR